MRYAVNHQRTLSAPVGSLRSINYIYYPLWFSLTLLAMCFATVTLSCNAEVNNNVTYFVNPKFPGLLNDVGECSLHVKKISKDISQMRLDFVNFNLVSADALHYYYGGGVLVCYTVYSIRRRSPTERRECARRTRSC